MKLNHYRILLVVVMIAATAVLSWWSIGRAKNFNAGWYDLGIMTQTVWNVGHGHGFVFTNPEVGAGGVHGINTVRTAIHTDYLLILLAPLSWFGSTMENLLVLQSVVLMFGAWFVWRISLRLLNRPWLSFLLSAAYIVYPPLWFAGLFEFHAVTLSATFFLAAADAITAKQHKLFWLWAGLALLTKEQVGITLGLLAGYLYWRQGDKRRAIISVGVSWIWSALQFGIVIPASRPGQATSFTYGKFYNGEASGFSLLHRLWPLSDVWQRLATRVHLDDLRQLLVPVGAILPLLSPIILLAIPEVLLYWLSDSPNQQTLYLHYHALFIPFIWLSLIFGWSNLESYLKNSVPRWKKGIALAAVMIVVLGSGYTAIKTSPWPWSPLNRWHLASWQEHLTPQVNQALRLIPGGASVGLTQNLGPLLAERQTVQLLPTGISQVQYIAVLERFFDSSIPTNDKRLAEKVMLDRLIPWLQASTSYKQLYHYDRVYVFQRVGTPTEPEPVWPAGLLGQ